MSETPQAAPYGQAQMQRPMGQPQDPNSPRPSISDNLQQSWQNLQGAPGRFMDSFQNAGQNLMGAPERAKQSVMGLGQLFK